MEKNPQWEAFLTERTEYAKNLLQLQDATIDLKFEYGTPKDNYTNAHYNPEAAAIVFIMPKIAEETDKLQLSETDVYPHLASISFHEVRHLYQQFWNRVNLSLNYAPEDFLKMMEFVGTEGIVYPKEKTVESVGKELLLPTELDATAFAGELTLRLYGYHIPLYTAEQVEQIKPYRGYISKFLDTLDIRADKQK